MTESRLPRCLRLIVDDTTGMTERCTAEQIPGSDLCASHLAEANRDFKAIVNRFTTGESTP